VPADVSTARCRRLGIGALGLNDLRGTASQTALSPPELADANVISRNLGTNRGKGLHPVAFR
jgi:hypothetical protein